MGRRRIEGRGLTYHVVSRGVRRSALYPQGDDYAEYLGELRELSREHGVAVLAFCLMPNHPHLCLRTDGDPLSVFMQRFHLRQAKRFNRRYVCEGHVFESRYRAWVVDSERYLLTLLRYIHANPVKAHLATSMEDWPHSSHQAYLDRAHRWVQVSEVLQRTGGRAGYCAAMRVPLTEEDEQLLAFEQRPSGIKRTAVIPSRWRLHSRAPVPELPIDQAARRIAASLGLALELLVGPDAAALAADERRRLVRELRAQGYLLNQIAQVLGRSEALASRLASVSRKRRPRPAAAAGPMQLEPGDRAAAMMAG